MCGNYVEYDIFVHLLGEVWQEDKVSKYFRRKDKLSGDITLSKLYCLTFEKRSILTEKNLLHLGADPFLFEQTPS